MPPKGGKNGRDGSVARAALYALLPAAVLWGAAEVGLRIWRPHYLVARAADEPYRYPPYPLRLAREDGSDASPGAAEDARYYGATATKGRGFLVPADKGDEFRVLCLGGSSVYGWPYPPGDAFPALLESDLRERTGEARPIRVVNGGVTGEWSAQVLARLRGMVVLRPDWVVLYLGHNDSARMHELLRAPSPLVRRLQRLAHRSWTYRWLAGYVVKARFFSDVWEDIPGMNARRALALWAELPHEDPLMDWSDWPETRGVADDAPDRRLEEHEAALRWIVRLYVRNLEEMVDVARAAGAEPLFVTPISRLHDSPPFESDHLRALSPEARRSFDAMMAHGRALLTSERPTEAAEVFREAATLSPTNADARYALGEALRAAGRWIEAREAFREARDWDLSASRARSRLIQAMREVAARKGAPLVDLEEEWRDCELCWGPAYFNDDLHPSREGHAALAARIADFLAPYAEGRRS